MKTSKADFWFSRYIRIRDTGTHGYCKCITCSHVAEPKAFDCGHYIKRQHQAVRFDEKNAGAQCGKCNRFEQGNDKLFREALIERYGEAQIVLMESTSKRTVKRSQVELNAIARYFKEKAIELANEKGLKIW